MVRHIFGRYVCRQVTASPAPGVGDSAFLAWPDGAGPLGGVNEPVSWNTQVETETGLRANLRYREE